MSMYKDSLLKRWNFSNGMDYAGLASRLTPLSSDDGIWGASISGLLDGNSPGPGLDANQGRTTTPRMEHILDTITAGTPLAYIYYF